MPRTSTRRRHPLRSLLPAVLVAVWAGMIFWFSDQPDLTVSSNDFADLVLRKAAHMFVFGVLLVLVWSMLRDTFGVRDIRRRIVLSLVLVLAYAISDEYHQTFVEGRVGHASDVAIDMTGALIALVALMTALRRRTALRGRKEP